MTFHVVNIQRRVMGGVATVDVPSARLEIRKP